MEEKFHKAKQFLRELNDAKKKLETEMETHRQRVLTIGSLQDQNVNF